MSVCTFASIAQAPDAKPKKVPLYMQHTEPSGKKIEYKKVGDKSLFLYALEPPTSSETLRPAIVFFHGGGWTGGNVGQFNRQANYLAAQGMVAFQVQYRLVNPHSSDTPQVCGEDAKSAMRWVRAHAKEFHVDPNRIVAAGGSAGGYLAAFVATVPGWNDPADNMSVSPKPNALALFFPAIDISPETSGNESISNRFGEGYKDVAPMEHVTRDTPPMIIMAGGADKQILPETLRHFKKVVDKAGVRCELIFYPGRPHGFANDEPYQTITLTATEHFLQSLGYLPKSIPDPVPPAGVSMVTPEPEIVK